MGQAELKHVANKPFSKHVTPDPTFRCYQCDKKVHYLFADSRCKDCTRQTPDEVKGE